MQPSKSSEAHIGWLSGENLGECHYPENDGMPFRQSYGPPAATARELDAAKPSWGRTSSRRARQAGEGSD
jgi:hypothetical protein